jgi:hypothetical protein
MHFPLLRNLKITIVASDYIIFSGRTINENVKRGVRSERGLRPLSDKISNDYKNCIDLKGGFKG